MTVLRTRFCVRSAALCSVALGLTLATPGRADDSSPTPTAPQDWALHAQATFTEQYHPAFHSPYTGGNSLDPASDGRETGDITAFFGLRPWEGGEIWINGEIDQGFGLSNTLGISAFPSGEAYKVGKSAPYLKLPRLFFRQTIDLGGDVQNVDPDINQFAMTQTANRLVITVGKFSVVDVFDHNVYADDPRHYFLNWALADLQTFDYAANAWGYTYGATAEWYQDWWVIRAGLFDLSNVPNSAKLEGTVGRQFQLVTEFEEDHTLWNRPGKIHLIAFMTHGQMALFKDAIALSQATGKPADVALVRHMHIRPGIGITFEQQITDDFGIFARAGFDDPSREPFEFTDADAAASIGGALNGKRWDRPNDIVGFALIASGITRQHAEYFNLGGLGILSGDGVLPHRGVEKGLEAYYDWQATDHLWVTPDYQFFANPAYNRDRGPVSILGIRVHTEI